MPTPGSNPPRPGSSDHAPVLWKLPNGYSATVVSPQIQKILPPATVACTESWPTTPPPSAGAAHGVAIPNNSLSP